jgi:hypothetical protein
MSLFYQGIVVQPLAAGLAVFLAVFVVLKINEYVIGLNENWAILSDNGLFATGDSTFRTSLVFAIWIAAVVAANNLVRWIAPPAIETALLWIGATIFLVGTSFLIYYEIIKKDQFTTPEG